VLQVFAIAVAELTAMASLVNSSSRRLLVAMIVPEAAVSKADLGKAFHDLNANGMFVSERPLDPQAQSCLTGNWPVRAIQAAAASVARQTTRVSARSANERP